MMEGDIPESGLWLKRKLADIWTFSSYPARWCDNEKPREPGELHWFPVRRNSDSGGCSLNLEYADIDSLPDEVLKFVDKLDRVALRLSSHEAAVKLSTTFYKLRNQRKLKSSS